MWTAVGHSAHNTVEVRYAEHDTITKRRWSIVQPCGACIFQPMLICDKVLARTCSSSSTFFGMLVLVWQPNDVRQVWRPWYVWQLNYFKLLVREEASENLTLKNVPSWRGGTACETLLLLSIQISSRSARVATCSFTRGNLHARPVGRGHVSVELVLVLLRHEYTPSTKFSILYHYKSLNNQII